MPSVTSNVLEWARTTAGLSLQEAATKLKVHSTRSAVGTDRLKAYEEGLAKPTRSLLLRMSKVYRRPLLTFYLQSPPARGDRGQDFRTLPERTTSAEPLVDALIRDVRARQAIVRSILEDEEDVEPLQFVGSMTMQQGVEPVMAAIRRALGFDLTTFRAQGSAEAAFTLLRQQAERIGVFVLLIGDLGSHHSAVEVEAFRGFALADALAPFILINDQDARSAWSFTLLHELAHLWLGATGISGRIPEGQVERFCNDVASGILLPNNEILSAGVDPRTEFDRAYALISSFADERVVSRSLVAYRLFVADRVSEQLWISLRDRFLGEWQRAKALAKERQRAKKKKTGPDYYIVRRHRLGPALLRFVARNLQEGDLTPTKAGKVLGVKARSVDPLLRGAGL